ncbi:MAG: hypothetical protein K0M67_02675 [Thiobacillus sp.]|nr:hypothetical protein [Thiobacillus sp.]
MDLRVNEICESLGPAIWEIQGVEEILAKYYSIVFRLADGPSLDEIESEFNRNFAHTCGRLVGLIRQSKGEQDPLAHRLSAFVNERAWLVHKLRRTDYLSLREDSGFSNTIARINSIETEAKQLIELFHNLLTDYFVNLGTPREVIERERLTR